MSNVEQMDTEKAKVGEEVALADSVGRLIEESGALDNLDKVRQSMIEAMLSSKEGDDRGRHRMWQAVRVLDAIKQHLDEILETGKIADAQMRQILDKETMMDRAKRRLAG